VDGAPAEATMEGWVAGLRDRGYRMNTPARTGRTRLVTHHGIDREDILAFLAATSEILGGGKQAPLGSPRAGF
jgi:hypothetical protein